MWLFCLLVFLATPLLAGYLIGFIIFVTPGIDRKVAVATFLIATPVKLFDEVMGAEIETEVEWIVRSRYGSFKAEYREMLDRAWGREKKK